MEIKKRTNDLFKSTKALAKQKDKATEIALYLELFSFLKNFQEVYCLEDKK